MRWQRADGVNAFHDAGVIAVRTVDPENVGPCPNQLGEHFIAVGGGAECGYDFGSIGQQHGL